MIKLLSNIYNKIEKSKYKILIFTLFFVFVVITRSFSEILLSSWYFEEFFSLNNIGKRVLFLILHWLFWYATAFFILFNVFRHFLKIEINKITYLSLSCVAILIPIISSLIMGIKMDVVYLNFSHFFDAIRGIFTLFYFDKNNYILSIEMLLIIIGSFFVSYILSKNFFKSIINVFLIYLFIGVFAGFSYICPSENCMINVESNMGGAYFMFYWIMCSAIFLFIFLFNEVKHYIKKWLSNLNYFNIALYFAFLFLVFIFSFHKSRYFIDWFLIGFSYSVFYFNSIFISNSNIKNSKYLPFFMIYNFFIFLSLVVFFLFK